MAEHKMISGFSKLSVRERMNLAVSFTSDPVKIKDILLSHLHSHTDIQNIYNQLSENSLSNYYLPYSVAPNFLIDGKFFVVPMVTEESSVVAAAAHAAKFWASHGGFQTVVKGTEKTGHVFFSWDGDNDYIINVFRNNKQKMRSSLLPVEENMKRREGGVQQMILQKGTEHSDNLYELFVIFETAGAMGANFMNSYLEGLAEEWKKTVAEEIRLNRIPGNFEIIMSILSNYTPHCLVKVSVACTIEELSAVSGGISPLHFAKKFQQAVYIAENNVYRAVTHNKGIMNGIDAVLLATGNDFRAVEAGMHSYAVRNGKYSALSHVEISGNDFRFSAEFPLALGVIGGITGIHPLASVSMDILGNPDVKKLMSITASVGIANNFSAVSSLISAGIQQGHMKMHLNNIFLSLQVNDHEKQQLYKEFKDKKVSYTAIKNSLDTIRKAGKL